MTTQTKQTQLNSELTLWESPESPIKIHALTIALTKEVHKVKDCRLTFQVTPEQYQLIDKQALFNLRPEVRTPLFGKPFETSSKIQIEAILEPDLLPQLTKHAKTSKKATTYLQTLSQEEPLHSLLSTYSWYALEVKQQQKAGETGFRTMWNYLK
ncbi:MAG: YbjN domain-containing protein, partial [Cyanobacteria bacterium P01_H01_bin.150]